MTISTAAATLRDVSEVRTERVAGTGHGPPRPTGRRGADDRARRSATPRRARGLRPKVALLAADAATIFVSAAVAGILFDRLVDDAGDALRHLMGATAMALPAWLAIFANQRLYNTRFIGRRIDEFRRIVNATILGTLAVSLAGSLANTLLRRGSLAVLAVTACLLVALEREIARRLFIRLRERGRIVRQVIVVGANPEGRDIAAMLKAEPWLGYEVVGFVDDNATNPEPVPGVPLLGRIDGITGHLRDHPGSSVIIATSGVESAVTNRLARDLLDKGTHVELSSSLRDIASQRLTVRPLGRFPIVYVEPVTRGGWRAAAKRTFDMSIAATAIVLTAPIIAIAAVWVKLDSRGPILFSQVRVGRDSEPFRVLKLRTMVVDAEERLDELRDLNEADGPLFKIKADPRVTRVGRFLRMTSIDELPQLWNVLRGDMSLVGPRPALPHETEEWDSLLVQRLRVKPGITGMWQVNSRDGSNFEDYTRLDLYYVDNWSLATDLAILLKTVPAVLLRRGAV